MRAAVMAALALSVLAPALRGQTALAPPPLSVQDTITVLPGDARLDVDRLLPHRATWRVTICDGDDCGRVQGLWTDDWARSEEDGQPTVMFRQLFVDTLGTILVDNETWFDAASFRGLRSTQRRPPSGGRVSYRFEGNTASGTLRQSADSDPREFTVIFDEPVWEPLTPVPKLLPPEDWELGMIIRYPVWNQVGPGGDVTWTTVRLDSIGQVRTADGSIIEAWHQTRTTEAAPDAVMKLLWAPEPPYGWWLRVERPALTREWTLVDWRPLTRGWDE